MGGRFLPKAGVDIDVCEECDVANGPKVKVKVTVRCGWGCGARLAQDMLAKHETDECSLREVLCPQGCDVDYLVASKLTDHLAVCPRRLVMCPLGCGSEVRCDQQTTHTGTFDKSTGTARGCVCSYRMVLCTGCQAGVKQSELQVHAKETCPMRLTPCVKGCSRMLLICNQVAHESQCEGTLPMTNIAGLQVSK